MSVSWGTQYAKLKTNLRLASNRLKLLQKKKTEQAQKARTEIADHILNDKADRARIRVESIIREDFVVEAYELLDMFCELLLARFGVVQQMNDQLTQKYGKQFAEAARMNQLPEPTRVSPKLVAKLGVTAPSKILVEKYLIEISKVAGVEFVPDPKVMQDDDDEIAAAERNLINFLNEDKIGWNVPAPPSETPLPPPPQAPPTATLPAHPPSVPGPVPFNYPAQPHNPGQPPQPHFQHPQQPPYQAGLNFQPGYHMPSQPPPPPQLNSQVPAPNDAPNENLYMVPKVSSGTHTPKDHIYELPPDNKNDEFLYNFPEPPTDFDDNHKGGSGGTSEKKDDLNFEDLAERFKRLNQK